MKENMEEVKKHPDFNEWLLTDDGKQCNDLSSLKEQQYLQNRLFWAFDAGRNFVWDEYQKSKAAGISLQDEVNRLVEEKAKLIDDIGKLTDVITKKINS